MFKFDHLLRYFFRTSNPEHPEDKIINATVEVLPVNTIERPPPYSTITNDGYFVIGGFKVMKGLADGFVPHILSPIQQLRISFKTDSDRWAIISEVIIN